MKFLLSILFVFSISYSANTVYTYVKTSKGVHVSLNAYIAAIGDTSTSLQIGNNWTVSGKNTAPATLDFAAFVKGAKIYGSTGSAVDTLVISQMSGNANRQIFDTSITIQFASGSLPSVRPEWFGFSTSASAAINAAALNKSFVGGGKIIIPKGTYNVNKIVCNDSCLIEGAGSEKTVLLSNVAVGDSSAVFNTKYLSIRDLTINGNKKASCVRITSSIHVDLVNVYIRNHIGKNCWLTSLESKIDHCRFAVDTGSGITPQCALYCDWNAIVIGGQSYFNAQNKCPAIIIGDNAANHEERSVTIENCTFESATVGIKINDSLFTSGINILNNYFELIQSTIAEVFRVTRGTHQSINIVGNHVGSSVKNSFVFDRINKESHVNISGNDIFRPIRIYTDTVTLTYFKTTNLPCFNIENQHKLFGAADFTTQPTKPTIIIDDYLALENLFVQRSSYSGYDYAYPKITGRMFFTSTYDTITRPFNLYITSAGGSAYANALNYKYDILWRRAKTATTGLSSYELENFKIDGTVRHTASSMNGLHTTTVLRSETSELSNATITKDHATSQLILNLIGEPATNLNQWFINFEINEVQ